MIKKFKTWKQNRANEKRLKAFIKRNIRMKYGADVSALQDFNPRTDGGKAVDEINSDIIEVLPLYYSYDDNGECLGVVNNVQES